MKDNAQITIDFNKYSLNAKIISLALIIASLFFLVSKGLNRGIDFTGGIIIEARIEGEFELNSLRDFLNQKDLGEIIIQHFGSNHDLLLRINKNSAANKEQLLTIETAKNSLKEKYSDIEFRRIDFVGPTVGEELIRKGIIALAAAFVAIMIYIWIRFDFYSGLGALFALIHDIIITFGFLSISQLEFNLTTIAALLIIIGYSINDSVVIYDRIRDNMRKYRKKPLAELINKSLNETLRRTLFTAGTTLVAIISLILFGGLVLKSFSLVVFVGVVIGTYSSIYIAAPILLFFHKNKRNQDVKDLP